jgi:hypothetical protein
LQLSASANKKHPLTKQVFREAKATQTSWRNLFLTYTTVSLVAAAAAAFAGAAVAPAGV